MAGAETGGVGAGLGKGKRQGLGPEMSISKGTNT